jgi:hypothetical protein
MGHFHEPIFFPVWLSGLMKMCRAAKNTLSVMTLEMKQIRHRTLFIPEEKRKYR